MKLSIDYSPVVPRPSLSDSLSGSLSDWADRLIIYGGQLGVPNPSVSLLAPCRRAAVDETLARFGPRAAELRAELDAGEAQAKAQLARLATAALAEMRRRAREHAARTSRIHEALALADRWWSETDASEHIDDPSLDPGLRQRAMTHLDQVNEMLGSYESFFELIRPLMAELGDRPLRVLELAAGHGGFALSLARTARRRGVAIEVSATDIKSEYLDLGRAQAEAERLPVRFELQDALDLGGLEPGAFDVVLCTQALHHFDAGAITVMLSESARVAGREVVFVDGSRTMLHAAPLYAYMRGRLRDPIIAHDGWVSCRRFFVPEELLLLARLAPRGEHATARWMPPTHCVLQVPAASGI